MNLQRVRVHNYIRACTHVYVHARMCKYTYVHVRTCMYTYMYVHIRTCLYVHIHVRTYVHIHVRMFTYVRTCTYVHMHVRTCTYIHVHVLCSHTITCTYVHVRAVYVKQNPTKCCYGTHLKTLHMCTTFLTVCAPHFDSRRLVRHHPNCDVFGKKCRNMLPPLISGKP